MCHLAQRIAVFDTRRAERDDVSAISLGETRQVDFGIARRGEEHPQRREQRDANHDRDDQERRRHPPPSAKSAANLGSARAACAYPGAACGANSGNLVIDAICGCCNHPEVSPKPTHPHRVVVVAFDGVQSLDIAGPVEVFAGASELLGRQGPGEAYQTTIVSLHGGVVTTESALRLDTDALGSLGSGAIDTLVLPGGFAVLDHRLDRVFVDTIAGLIERCARLVTVCSGTYLAAAAGALEGHTVTTHWARANRLAELHPEVTVDSDPIFIHSAGAELDVWSSAGVTAGIDLALALVEQDHSTDLAQTVARWLVMYLRRPGGQSQFASPTWIRQAPPGPIQQAQELIIGEPGGDHRIAALARRVAMSERHFVRRFGSEVGMPPAKFVAHVRVDAARQELERSSDTVATIAKRCGFGTAETLRRSLHRHLGVSPRGLPPAIFPQHRHRTMSNHLE